MRGLMKLEVVNTKLRMLNRIK